MKKLQTLMRLLLLLTILVVNFTYSAKAQVGTLIWEDNFDSFNSNIWGFDVGDGCDYGICGWGNQELQYYRSENAFVSGGTLKIQAKRETFGGKSFTSSRITSRGKLTVQYGMIEVRLKTPNLANGLWPAFWLLGKSTQSWPAKGEIDMMEMGYGSAERTRQGYPNSTVNQFVGANLFWRSSTACNDQNTGCVANSFYDVNFAKPYVPAQSMADQFFRYRMYWDPNSIRFTVVDNSNVETDLYESPFPINPTDDSEEFRKPFHLLMNMAVGGSFTSFNDPAQITATMPATMEIDYLRVYKWNGAGTVNLEYNNKETGVFGVYTDNTPTTKKLTIGTDAALYAWNTANMATGSTAPYEGTNVITWKTLTASQWFGGGVVPDFYKNMSNYSNGNLKFRIKIPDNIAFKIGITSSKEVWLNFPANQTTYGLVRNGAWGEVSIPIKDFGGIELDNINYMFAIASISGQEPSSTFEMAIDDIRWEAANTCTALPSPWQTADIGTVAATGSACVVTSSNEFTVKGSGADIWGTADGFRYMYQTLSGDGEIIARVASLTNTNAWAKAGVMIRESTAANAKNAMVAITPTQGVAFQRRTSTGGSSVTKVVAGITAPNWVRLVRSGNTFTAYYSTNGTAWSTIESVTISMTTNVLIGLPVTSHNDGVLCTAVFSNVQIKTPASLSCNQSATNYSYTITGTASSATFTFTPKDGSTFTDFKYKVNGGAQLSVRMTPSGSNHAYTVSNVVAGDRIDYFFVYGILGGTQSETTFATHPDYIMGTGCAASAAREIANGKNKTVLFPSPANEYINLTKLPEGINSIELYDALGQLVLRKGVNDGGLQKISIQQLNKGLYFLLLLNANNVVERLKFAKQ